jgi:hypothetical protein
MITLYILNSLCGIITVTALTNTTPMNTNTNLQALVAPVEVRLQEMRANRKPYTESELDDDLIRFEEDRAWDSFLEDEPVSFMTNE